MIKSIHFQNFKALRDATLPLGPFTLIVGPNGSGKSTAMQAFEFSLDPDKYRFEQLVTAGVEGTAPIEITIEWGGISNALFAGSVTTTRLKREGISQQSLSEHRPRPGILTVAVDQYARRVLTGFRVFSFDARFIAAPVQTRPNPKLGSNGSDLAAVLDALRDSHPEKFEDLNREFHRWLPEFDRILFETPSPGYKVFLVRTTIGGHKYRAIDLSQGVLFALAFLALAYLPTPPPVVCFEEPDRGIHPRLLVDIRDAMYRLAFPSEYGEKREPVQVIATTHSPYLLDLYKEHPEQIVISHKDATGAQFERLSDKPHISEILNGAPLGDIWFSGILGGVPANP